MNGLKITSAGTPLYDAVYGDMRGGHIRVFKWQSAVTNIYVAHYASGKDGILLDACGQGYTANEAVRGLWKVLHP